MGKWDGMLDSLPKLPAGMDAEKRGNKEWLDRVEAKKAEWDGKGTTTVAFDYREARKEKDRLEEDLKPVNLKITALSGLLESRFKAEDLKSITAGDGASVGVHYEPYAQIEDKAAVMEWAILDAMRGAHLNGELMEALADATKTGDMTIFLASLAGYMAGQAAFLAVQWQTLNSALKEALEDNLEPPPGVKAFLLPKVSLRGAK